MQKSLNTFLRRAYDKKRKDFKGFSMRWMAGQLGVTHAYISQIFSGKRSLPVAMIEPFCKILDLDNDAQIRIYREILKEKGLAPLGPEKRTKVAKPINDWPLVPVKDFEVVSNAGYTEILMATLLEEYDGTSSFISERLGLTKSEVVLAMNFLKERGFLSLQNNILRVSNNFYEFQSRREKNHFRSYHKSVMSKAQNLMDLHQGEADLERRLITSATMTVSRKSIPLLKQKIADFLKEFAEDSAEGNPEELYHFGLQFFPASKLNKKN